MRLINFSTFFLIPLLCFSHLKAEVKIYFEGDVPDKLSKYLPPYINLLTLMRLNGW